MSLWLWGLGMVVFFHQLVEQPRVFQMETSSTVRHELVLLYFPTDGLDNGDLPNCGGL